jgi:hypothetical protein
MENLASVHPPQSLSFYNITITPKLFILLPKRVPSDPFNVGTYGETYLALWREPGRAHKVTVKKLFDTNFTPADLEYFRNETKSLV